MKNTENEDANDANAFVLQACNGLSYFEVVCSVKQLFNAMNLDMHISSNRYQLIPSEKLNKFMTLGDVFAWFSNEYSPRNMTTGNSIEELVKVVLTAENFCWHAVDTQSQTDGTISVENSFCRCNTIEEALVHADLLHNENKFAFIRDPFAPGC